MSHLTRIQETLPPIYAIERDAILTTLLDAVALEMDTFQEDLDRYQRTHWIEQVYRLSDAEKMGALLGIARLPWEQLETYRERLIPLTVALLSGATGPRQIRSFVFDYLRRAETVLECTFVPGLVALQIEEAFGAPAGKPLYRPLELRENPPRTRRSVTLESAGGKVPYLQRWREFNKGLRDTVATFHIGGVYGGGPSVPILVNLTTGDLIGYKGTLRFGESITIKPPEVADANKPRLADASFDDVPAGKALFSVSNFKLGVPFRPEDLDPEPLLPRMARGANDWLFLSVGLYDSKGLDRFFYAVAGENLREGVFDETSFDDALFPSGTKAKLEMSWIETEPASFEVRVPRYLVAEPSSRGDGPAYQDVAEGLRTSIRRLHAAGVRAEVVFEPFVETQRQLVRFQVMYKAFELERGTAGQDDTLNFGGRFGESVLGGSRFE